MYVDNNNNKRHQFNEQLRTVILTEWSTGFGFGPNEFEFHRYYFFAMCVDHNIDNVVESYIIPTDVRSLLYNVRLNHDPLKQR